MTKGKYRVGVGFNPSGDDNVTKIKAAAAELIDMIEALPVPDLNHNAPDDEFAVQVAYKSEISRLKALAQTHVEDAAMWAVKAATKQAPTVFVATGGEHAS